MMLHLIRHAHAVAASEDPRRPLSDHGRIQVSQLVAFFRANNRLRPAAIWHSPLVRSRETAALLAAGLGFSGPLIEMSDLEPEDDPQVIVAKLAHGMDHLVIVGHEPHLSALASLLVCGSPKRPIITLKKAASAALERDEGGWRVRWLTGPELIGTGNQLTTP